MSDNIVYFEGDAYIKGSHFTPLSGEPDRCEHCFNDFMDHYNGHCPAPPIDTGESFEKLTNQVDSD